MCGITGFVQKGLKKNEYLSIAKKMETSIIHRGPDDSGHLIDIDRGVALAHRRLSIIDLSPAGHQPMVSRDDRYSIIFNGEIYNHKEIKEELEKDGYRYTYKGHSDTEVMLAAISFLGIKVALKKFNGMFAFALLDKKENLLYLARDRMGEKPLYYTKTNKAFIFGSELKSLCEHPEFKKDIDKESVSTYLRHNYIPAPHTIYQNCYKLLPGTFLTYSIYEGKLFPLEYYWNIENKFHSGMQIPFDGTEWEAVKEFERLLIDSTKIRMESDVPLGAFLSGGYDSSTVVGVMQSLSVKAVRTFSIGFEEEKYNEAVYAKKVAEHLKTDHTELYVTPKDALDVIPKLPIIYDEPFADSSQIPTYLVSALTRKHVTVSLSGDGGDELFGGYSRYPMAMNANEKLNSLPLWLRQTAAGAVQKTPAFLLNGLLFPMGSILQKMANNQMSVSYNLRRAVELLSVNSRMDLYKRFMSHYQNPAEITGVKEKDTVFSTIKDTNSISFLSLMCYLDFRAYLPDDILVKVDRASMAVSLESRIPLLDHRIVEFAMSLPDSFKIKKGKTKWILREVAHKYIPKEIMERPKMGFGVPIDRWLRNELKDWAEDLLSENSLKKEGFFDPARVRNLWKEHLSGSDRQYELWDILMFNAWLRKTL